MKYSDNAEPIVELSGEYPGIFAAELAELVTGADVAAWWESREGYLYPNDDWAIEDDYEFVRQGGA